MKNIKQAADIIKNATGAVAYKPGASYTGNAALTLYAVWKRSTYDVGYDLSHT